ncbi:Ferredoxin-3, chloroplastic [Hordeum vulgare]|uniref:Ferredoxin n=1 Tax=Hordeum vulgare subsp. vulgare TaxID=112509 RepID=A0A8I6YX46_HORVV|nr:ferredoxin, root R-B1-like [Hordeum vulgare subsp. vulgare]KAE8809180.1 Ferredoxin-3, chloroplastic [Hordeum vulgare]
MSTCPFATCRSLLGSVRTTTDATRRAAASPRPPSLSFAGREGALLQVPGLLIRSSLYKPNVSAAAVYRVKLVTPEGREYELEAPDDAYILDTAESAGVELPCACRAGACYKCAAKVEAGMVHRGDGSLLHGRLQEEGYVLICVSCPRSDCVIHTHKEDDLW